MLIFQAIFMAIVQSICEFLPISSSAHLILVAYFFHFDKIFIDGQTFDIALHLGSLIAIIICFKKEFKEIIISFFLMIFARINCYRKIYYDKKHVKLAFLIIIGTIPLAIVGFFFKNYAETIFKNPILIATVIIIFGYFLYFFDKKAEKFEKKIKKQETIIDISFKNAIIIGFFQVFSIVPGVSRSGITITAARILKINREISTKFSFLLAVPTICGALILEINNFSTVLSDKSQIFYFLLGIFCSIIFSYVVINFFLKYLRTHSFKVFFVYRLILGIIILFAYFIK
ncbi:MAG: undecaprenyl-diphosphate phosphatase [Elusimicrobiota bacterium]|nr:undecaprenyl-diphosphate phosphatase [Elusimicrobiota bacterium]